MGNLVLKDSQIQKTRPHFSQNFKIKAIIVSKLIGMFSTLREWGLIICFGSKYPKGLAKPWVDLLTNLKLVY